MPPKLGYFWIIFRVIAAWEIIYNRASQLARNKQTNNIKLVHPSCKSNIHLEIAESVAAAESGMGKNVLSASLIIPGHK